MNSFKNAQRIRLGEEQCGYERRMYPVW
ncbi:MAG: hypothetical protein QOH21_428, partial [Acidobacteriota bacterium]|nr:hypothetical protein [Acidobacteriota bacterium]